MLKLWGRANSVNVQKVTWCCEELGVPYERTDVGGEFGGTRDTGYLAMNPNGLIPTISDDGFTLWEANVIVRYLSAKHGPGTLCPEDVARRADADRWMDWQLGTLWANMRPLFIGLVRTPPEERDPASIEAARESTLRCWNILDEHLVERGYVSGASFTMGDIPLGATVHRWLNLDIERPPMPNVEAWYSRLCERPAYKANVVRPLS